MLNSSCKTLMKAITVLEYVKLILFNLLFIPLEKQIHCCNNIQALGFLEQDVTVSLLKWTLLLYHHLLLP